MKLIFRNIEQIPNTPPAYNTFEIVSSYCNNPFMLWQSDTRRRGGVDLWVRCPTLKGSVLLHGYSCIKCLVATSELLQNVKLKDIQYETSLS